MTASKRLSQAISEGDGISLISPVDGPDAARAAERDGAKAVLVRSGGRAALAPVVQAVEVPVVVVFDGQAVEAVHEADACVVEGDLDWLERVQGELGHAVELAIRVDDEEHLERVLERLDPEILVLANGGAEDERLPNLLALLSDVPAGKLAIAELERADRAAIAELERAGCDAVVVGAPASRG